MKAAPLLINWHDDHSPIYSVNFDPHGKGRLATAGKYVSIAECGRPEISDWQRLTLT